MTKAKFIQVDGIPNFYINLASGIYYSKVMVNGRVVWRSTRHTSRGKALIRHHAIMAELEAARNKPGWDKKIPTVQEFWETYRKTKTKSAGKWARDEGIMRLHFLPAFGKFRVDEITQSQMERQLNWRKKKVAAGTVETERSFLHAFFQAAVDDELMLRNPMRKIPKGSYSVRKRVLQPEEQTKLLAKLSSEMSRWVVFMLGTGLRMAEALALRPAVDIDWTSRTLVVTGKGHLDVPRMRDVPLLSETLDKVIQEQVSAAPGAKLWPRDRQHYQQRLKTGWKAAGVAHLTPHTLRHTFATRYLQSGGNIYVLSRILGHSTVLTTEKIYAHLVQADNRTLSAHVELGLVTEKVVEEATGDAEVLLGQEVAKVV